MKTRAAVMYEHNQPVVVEELELDDPKENEVLVRKFIESNIVVAVDEGC